MRPLLALLAPHRRRLALALCAMAVLALATGLYAWLVGPLLAFLFTGGTRGYEAFFALLPGVEPGGLDRRALTLVLPGVILAVAALKGIAYFVQLALMGRIGQAIAATLRRELFARVLDAERTPLLALDGGDLATRAAADVDAVQEGLVQAAAALVRDGLTLLVLMTLAVSLDWALALLAFVVLPVALFPIVRFGRRLRRSTHQGHEARGALASRLVETHAGRDVLRTPAARADARGRFDAEVAALEAARVRAVATRAASHPIMEFLGVGGLAVTLWFAAFRIWSGALDPAAFVSFFAAVLMLYEPLKGLSRASAWLHEARAGLDRLAPLLALAPAPDGSGVPARLEDAVRLRDVAVAHGATPVLEGASLTLERGTTTVLYGASGAGKTSLLRVVAGLAAPCAGSISWDAQPYATLRRSALAARIGYLDQDALLFARSVRENLALGATVPDAALVAALEQAGAWDFVADRGGLDAVLVEGGRDLSGGQRRRLALARALAQAPDLLLLDEPTDAIDPATEQHILATLRALAGGCTVLVVAHRPELIPWAEQRLELVPGRAGAPARLATAAPASDDRPALLPA